MEIKEAGRELIESIQKGDFESVRAKVVNTPNIVNYTEWYLRPLHYAVRAEQEEIVDFLLENGANPSPPEETCVAPSTLELAKLKNNKKIVSLLERHLAKSYNSSSIGCKLAIAAQVRDHLAIEEMLQENPRAINDADTEGNTALHWAVLKRDKNLINLLIEKNANLDAIRCDGKTPSHLCLYPHQWWMNRFKFEALELLDLLKNNGADYNICIASAIGDLKRVKELLKQDRSIANFFDTCKKRPLSCASEAGHYEVVKLLLENGADPNLEEALCDGSGYSLYGACWGKHVDCVEILLKYGANPNVSVDSSGNPLTAAGDNQEIIELLHGYNAKPLTCLEIPKYESKASLPLIQEWFASNPDKVNEGIMLLCGGDPEQTDFYQVAIDFAFEYGADPESCPLYVLDHALQRMPSIAKSLLKHGVSANLQCKYTGKAIQHCIAESNNIDAMETLIEHGSDLNLRDFEFQATPLTFAVRKENEKMVEYLIDNGSEVNPVSEVEYNSPFYWAEKLENKSILNKLKNALRS